MEGSWIFLSHSSKDIKLVRKIRNEFEEHGHNPLAFHLKCLNARTSSGRQEIFELLRREIDAREWFVFCESENSKHSEYVSYERNYIFHSGKKHIWKLDLTREWDVIREDIARISRSLVICIRCMGGNWRLAHELMEQLQLRDYTVWLDLYQKSTAVSFWRDALQQEMMQNDVLQNGLEILVISRYTDVPVLQDHLRQIIGSKEIITVFAGEFRIDPETEGLLRNGIYFDVPEYAGPEVLMPLLQYIDSTYTDGILTETE